MLTGFVDPDIAGYDFAISDAWWSVLKYGETQIWGRSDDAWFNTRPVERVERSFRDCIESFGLDFELVLAGDVDESAKRLFRAGKRTDVRSVNDGWVASRHSQ